LRDALLHSSLNDVFQVDHAQQTLAIAHGQWGSTVTRNAVAHVLEVAGDTAAALDYKLDDRVGCSLAKLAPLEVDPAHPGVGREWDEGRFVFRNVTAAKTVFLFGQYYD